MHNTHFLLTKEEDPKRAISWAQCYLEELNNLDGADYFSIESAINLRTGQTADGYFERKESEFSTLEKVKDFFTNKYFNIETINKRLLTYRKEIREGLVKEDYWLCEYDGKRAAIELQKIKIAREPITLERMINDYNLEVGAYTFTEVGITRIDNTDCPTLVIVDFHS